MKKSNLRIASTAYSFSSSKCKHVHIHNQPSNVSILVIIVIENIKIKSPALTRVNHPVGFMRPSRFFEFLKSVLGELVHYNEINNSWVSYRDWDRSLPWIFCSIREGVTLLGSTTVYTHTPSVNDQKMNNVRRTPR